MSNVQVRNNRVLRTIAIGVLLGCVALPSVASIPITDPVSALEDGMELFEDKRFQNAQDALINLSASTAFRRLDAAQKTLAYSHIAYAMINRGNDMASVKYIDSALKYAKMEFGERSMAYLDHMHTKVIALYWANKRNDAVRVAQKMESILERMGREDYADEIGDVQSMISQLKRVSLKEPELPTDLSDFYTQCESISADITLVRANAIMGDFLLVGEGFKPSYKQSDYFKNTYLVKAKESSSDRRNRMIYIPDDEHLQDWCVVYRDGKNVDRAVVSSKSSR